MSEPVFEFMLVEHQYPLLEIEKKLGEIKDLPVPVEWAMKNFKLAGTGYADHGDFYPRPWQVEPINAIRAYDTLIFCGPTQTGKSLISEIVVGYCVDCIPMNVMWCYADKETAQDVYEERIAPMIQDVPVFRQYWSGRARDLTRRKIKLSHIIMRVASAGVKNDIATFSAGITVASEAAKYRIKPRWHPIEGLRRRQAAYRMMGRHKEIVESSPVEVGDPLHGELMQPDVLVLRPYQQCPLCQGWQVLEQRQIKEIPAKNGKKDHDPARILAEKAARYECIHCKGDIPESARVDMCERVVWASETERIDENGEISGRIDKKKVAFWWNRLVDYSYSYADSLSALFSAQRKGIEAVHLMRNEDNAEFVETVSKVLSEDYLRQKCAKYRQFVPGDIPNDVLVLIMGVDTQDNGWYYVVNGYGPDMHKYLVRSGFIESPKGLSEGRDPHQVAYERFRAGIYGDPYIRRDGRVLPIVFGLMDLKGHRADDCRYIAARMPELDLCSGLAKIDPKKPRVWESTDGAHWNVQTQFLSEEVGNVIESSKYHLPEDVLPEYLDQVRNQYIEIEVDKYGGRKRRFVKKDPDHFRSAEDYCLAATEIKGLSELLHDESTVEELQAIGPDDEPDPEPDDDIPDYIKRRRR